MRVISGIHRGRNIKSLKTKSLRPTMGLAREALFNILSHGRFIDEENPLLNDSRVLDLFCGCGALSMEALSRGAEHVTLVDINSEHLNIARQNIRSIDSEGQATFLRQDSTTPPRSSKPYNLVFVDPPYRANLSLQVTERLTQNGLLAPGAIVVVETAKTEDFPTIEGFEELENRKYGNSRIRILQWQHQESA